MITYSVCPLCQSHNISHWLKTTDFMLSKADFGLWKCNDCSFVFTQDIPSPGEIGRYYQSKHYISHSDTRKGLMNKMYHLGRTFMLNRKYAMVRKTVKGDRLLDIGTGTGYFAGYMKKKGFQVIGVEIDPSAREFAKTGFGIRVHTPEDFLEGRIQGEFDVISMWHVLEHLDNFDLYIGRMLKHLASGGVLVVALPNHAAYDARHYKKFWAGYDVPRHLWHFTPVTIQKLAEKHGLVIKKMKKLPLDPFYNSMLSEKYKGNKLFMISGMIIGKLAYLESLFSLKKSSSLVYFLTTKALR